MTAVASREFIQGRGFSADPNCEGVFYIKGTFLHRSGEHRKFKIIVYQGATESQVTAMKRRVDSILRQEDEE